MVLIINWAIRAEINTPSCMKLLLYLLQHQLEDQVVTKLVFSLSPLILLQ